MISESYVVRIYRRDPDHPDRMDGILISANAEGGQAFHGSAELLRLLTLGRGELQGAAPGRAAVTAPANTNENERR